MLTLDRVELADIFNPEKLVQAIYEQKPDMPIPVPIEDLVIANDIKKIEKLVGAPEFVGMLATDESKNIGQIWVGGDMRSTRQRFTIAHEFGHFLLPHHKEMKYECTFKDLTQSGEGGTPEADREWEANRFAAELMLPKKQFLKRLGKVSAPCLSHVQELANYFDMSVEATCRRYLSLSGFSCCLIFSQNGIVNKYPAKSPNFPYWLNVKPKQKVPKKSVAALNGDGLSDFVEINSYEWLSTERRNVPDYIYEQTLFQEDGYALTIVWVNDADFE
jgi:Zn-dependent peptidase ImmA (M78 family)